MDERRLLMPRLPWRTHVPHGWAEMVAKLELNPLEEWALLKLLDWQWTHGSIPSEREALLGFLRANGLPSKTVPAVRFDRVLEVFKPHAGSKGERLVNVLLHAEREKAAISAAEASVRGKRAAAARYSKTKHGAGSDE